MSTKKQVTSPLREGASSETPRKIKCPKCSKLIVYDFQDPNRPFCSVQCKTGDLAAWASDEYRVPEVKRDRENHDADEAEEMDFDDLD